MNNKNSKNSKMLKEDYIGRNQRRNEAAYPNW